MYNCVYLVKEDLIKTVSTFLLMEVLFNKIESTVTDISPLQTDVPTIYSNCDNEKSKLNICSFQQKEFGRDSATSSGEIRNNLGLGNSVASCALICVSYICFYSELDKSFLRNCLATTLFGLGDQ